MKYYDRLIEVFSYFLGHFLELCPGNQQFPHKRFAGGAAVLDESVRIAEPVGIGVPDLPTGFG